MFSEHDNHQVRSDWDKLSKAEFDRRYPEYKMPNWDWLLRRRYHNGLIESGALVESAFGATRKRCLIVPALLNWSLYGEEPIAAKVDLTLAQIQQTNERLAALESKLTALVDGLLVRNG